LADNTPLRYLLIGHVTQDVLPSGEKTLGGTVTYSARTALALGCRVGIVTSTAPDLDLGPALAAAGADIARQPSAVTSTFENRYTASGREQLVHAVAAPLDYCAVPAAWRAPDLVHLAPVIDECDPALVDAFPGARIVATPQGWLRAVDAGGRVRYRAWAGMAELLPRLHAAVMSIEDVRGDEATVARFARLAPVLAVTLGAQGCRVYAAGEVRHIPVTPIDARDPTGAGDVFAAAFCVHLCRHGDPFAAGAFANRVAALSLMGSGWASTPAREQLLTLHW
jgi:sugar/nucleoside kinase (ribokinase family)